MMSKLAKGLFHKAILMSGTSFIGGCIYADSKELTERFARELGWDGTGGEKKILEVLEAADGKKMVEVETKLVTLEENFTKHIMFPFTPVIEPYETPNSFMPKDPALMARDCWSNDIDCMLGATTLEGGLMGMIEGNYWEFMKTSKDYSAAHIIGLDANDAKNDQQLNDYGDKIKKLYFGEAEPSLETRYQYFLVRVYFCLC